MKLVKAYIKFKDGRKISVFARDFMELVTTFKTDEIYSVEAREAAMTDFKQGRDQMIPPKN